MVACTIITVVSLPMYSALYRSLSTLGLTFASDLGIVANTVVLAVLLHRRGLVPAGDMPWMELAKATVIAAVAGVLGYRVASLVTPSNRIADLETFALGAVTWAATVALGLWLTRSRLLDDLRQRKGTAQSRGEAG